MGNTFDCLIYWFRLLLSARLFGLCQFGLRAITGVVCVYSDCADDVAGCLFTAPCALSVVNNRAIAVLIDSTVGLNRVTALTRVIKIHE